MRCCGCAQEADLRSKVRRITLQCHPDKVYTQDGLTEEERARKIVLLKFINSLK